MNNPQYTFREYEKGEPEKYATKVFNWHAYRLDASFLKAYYHFELWKRYGDIAIADKLLTESEALALERTPGQEVVEYIVHALDSLAPMYDELETMTSELLGKVTADMDSLTSPQALMEIFAVIQRAIKYIDVTAPWALAKDEAN